MEIDMPASTEFNLHYEVPRSEISSSTLIETLIGVQTIVRESNRQLDPGKQVELRVQALGGGSFEVGIQLNAANIIGAIASFFSTTSIAYLNTLLDVISKSLTLSKWRAENKAIVSQEERPDGIVLTNVDGDVLIFKDNTFNVTMSPSVGHGANRLLSALAVDPEVQAFQVRDKEDEPLFAIESPELRMIAAAQAKPVDEDVEQEPRIITRTVELEVVKPSFDPKYKWDVWYKGVKTAISVTDQEFLERVRRHEEVFGAGDILKCDLTTTELYDADLGGYVEKGREIVTVHGHISKPQTTTEDG